MKRKIKFKNVVKHFILITKHRWLVFKLCCKIGLFWRGFVHDLSKYSPTEFWESVRYYEGNCSPIVSRKQDKGYSEAWLHHKGRNKHHSEYWLDRNAPEQTPIMPYVYTAEMICDKLAAGIVYNGKAWTKETQINYHMKEREKVLLNPHIDNFLIAVFTEVSKDGLDKVITKQNIKNLYEKYCIRMENLDENKI